MFTFLLIGWITIVSSVSGANVMVDEQDGIPMSGKMIRLQVEEGLHVIMVDKEGYRPYIDTMTIHAGANQSLTVYLEPTKKNNMHMRWVGVGAGLGTGLDLHVSLFDMRFGLLTIDPCTWGMNIPFYTQLSHVKTPYLVHPRNRRSESTLYETAIPTQNIQFYYTPMIGMSLPIKDNLSFCFSAGPQISWTHISWSKQWREDPFTTYAVITSDPFPSNGFQFDQVWFSISIGTMWTGLTSDVVTYLKYQDGITVGVELRF